jgi:hypothetical protein
VDKVVLEKCLLIDIVVMSAFFLRFMVGMGRGWKRWLHSEPCCAYSLCIRWCTVPWLRVLLQQLTNWVGARRYNKRDKKSNDTETVTIRAMK